MTVYELYFSQIVIGKPKPQKPKRMLMEEADKKIWDVSSKQMVLKDVDEESTKVETVGNEANPEHKNFDQSTTGRSLAASYSNILGTVIPPNTPLSIEPAQIKCQFCKEQIETETKPIHWKTLHSSSQYHCEICTIILLTLFPLFWPFTIYYLSQKPWLGSQHKCPKCGNCVGIHFSDNYTGYALSPNQVVASIPYNPAIGRVAIKAF